MSSRVKSLVALLLAIAALLAGSRTLFAAEADEEQKLISIIQSATAGPAEKDAACARLKLVGTKRCVPALASLLTNEQLSHSARYALEPMPFDEAGSALRNALTNTTALLRMGIISSLAVRNDSRAVTALAQLLHDTDGDTQKAAAFALGQIGGTDAATALRASAHDSTPLHGAVVDALLRCATRMQITGQRSMALAIFEQLDAPAENENVRVAAFSGRVRVSGNAGLNMMLHALAGPPDASQLAALQLARDLPVPNTTRELGRLLPDLKPPVQGALLQVLAQRGDATIVPAVVTLAKTAPSDTQPAIVAVFDELGDASVVPLLATWAGSGSPDVQKAARHALVDLHRGNVTQALIDQLSNASPAVQVELARALGSRGDKAAVPKLVELARTGPAPAQRGVFQALGLLVDASQLRTLVDLVLQSKDPDSRAQSAESLNAAYLRLQTQKSGADVAPLVEGIQKGSPEARVAMLPICAGLTDPAVRAALRASLNSQNAAVHNAAVRALCDTVDGELLPDLVELACSTPDDSVRSMAISGAVRLATQEETVKLPPKQRVAALKSLMACASSAEQKRKVLAGLGEVGDIESLALVATALDDRSVCNEAARATVKIASAMTDTDTMACAAALKKALTACNQEGTRKAVEDALRQVQNNSDYLTNWEVSGPYRQADKDYAALFDIVFPPEANDAKEVKWQKLTPGTDPKRPWVMDLLKALGGQQCVAYARTWVHCDQQQNAILELGSDDGVKVWLNDKQVYALNVARPLQPASDKLTVTLHQGWNPLMLKITQNNQGWEFCVRVRNAEGSHLSGVRCDSSPNLASAKP
jgi:HEAT repeat protein